MGKMEILAPAGSKESFITAVEAGADAVYCGLKEFSARSKAGNFYPDELASFTEYAHKKNVKVYVAFNTLVKEAELKKAVRLMSAVSQTGADAVIIQDFGIANMVKNHFPELKMHASTQMSVHNSAGVLEAQKSGFKRVVLARELSLEEIKEIKKKTSAELEIFCHGALCFGVSGICLMSSFIGGRSANRGACAQPCRRIWSFKDKKGFYISPKDLDLSAYMKEISASGVSSLKIEGRMKNAQYVYKTVKAYRMLADSGASAEALKEAAGLLALDFARPKTSFNFINASKDIFSPQKTKQSGIFIGRVHNAKNGSFEIKTEMRLNKNDILKAADPKNDMYHKIGIISMRFSGGVYFLETDSRFIGNGMEIFKTSDASLAAYLKDIIEKTAITKKSPEFKEKNVKFPLFSKELAKEKLFIKTDNAQWIKFLDGRKTGIIFALSAENAAAAENLNDADYFEIPPYIGEADLPAYKKIILKLARKKKKFFLNNIGHFSFFDKLQTELYAGSFLYSLNSFSVDFLFKKGVRNFVFSAEDDIKNIKELSKSKAAAKGIFYLSGFLPLALSAMSPHADMPRKGIISSQKDSLRIETFCAKTAVLARYPVMLFDKKEELKKAGISRFIIDLSFIEPDKKYLSCVLDAFYGKRPLQGGLKFNFDRGLK